MNWKIRYDDLGEISVTNEEAFPKKREYQDNIEDVLALENIVEGLSKEYDDYKNQVSNLSKKRKQMKDKIKKHRKSRIFWYVLQLIIIPIIGLIGFYTIGSITLLEVLGFLGVEVLATLGTLTFGHLYQDGKNYQEINELNEKINGFSIALIAAKRLVEKKAKELEELKSTKSTLQKEDKTNQVKEIEYKEDLLRIKTYLTRMYRYGTNEDYYQKLIRHNHMFDMMYERYEKQENTRKRTKNLEKENERRKMNTSY